MDPTPEVLRRAHYWMRFARAFDDRCITMYKQGKIAGGYFSQLGHEAISVGASLALGSADIIAPMHRDVGAYFVRGLTPRRVAAQYYGRAAGPSGGRDANMHGLGDLSIGIVGFVSHLPQSLPVAAGIAHAFKLKREPRVAMTFVGDGSASEGLAHETLNWAGVFQLPIVFIVENNQYAYSTPLARQTRVPDLARRADGYGIPGLIVDGNDFFAVFTAASEAVERARAGGGPTLIECKTMRMRGHAIHDNMAYVPPELIAEWQARDPIIRFEEQMRARGQLDEGALEEMIGQIETDIDDALAFADQAPYPDPATLRFGVYADSAGGGVA
ncbi:MAG: thiamine pyrophosphate-dependent dehydrogenase E1 component subunit alpha [Chloroflexi bacterium]|nr:thiamine pyrophosphate-dependent dehydrogenase E1 component subunit alpha [Chloroflexota bacterium]